MQHSLIGKTVRFQSKLFGLREGKVQAVAPTKKQGRAGAEAYVDGKSFCDWVRLADLTVVKAET